MFVTHILHFGNCQRLKHIPNSLHFPKYFRTVKYKKTQYGNNINTFNNPLFITNLY